MSYAPTSGPLSALRSTKSAEEGFVVRPPGLVAVKTTAARRLCRHLVGRGRKIWPLGFPIPPSRQRTRQREDEQRGADVTVGRGALGRESIFENGLEGVVRVVAVSCED